MNSEAPARLGIKIGGKSGIGLRKLKLAEVGIAGRPFRRKDVLEQRMMTKTGVTIATTVPSPVSAR
jgi:hypothetical protein